MFSQIYLYGTIGIVVVLGMLGLYHTTVVSGLENEITRLEKEAKLDQDKIGRLNVTVGLSKANIVTLKASIVIQNTKVEEGRVKYEMSLKDLENWKAKPEKVRYTTVYKSLDKIDIKQESCDVTKNTITAVSNIDYGALQRL